MTYRVTIKMLESQIAELNRRAGFDGAELWTRDGKRNVATVGMYYIDQVYGGYNLARITNEGGGATLPLGYGARTKRELHRELSALLIGMAL